MCRLKNIRHAHVEIESVLPIMCVCVCACMHRHSTFIHEVQVISQS